MLSSLNAVGLDVPHLAAYSMQDSSRALMVDAPVSSNLTSCKQVIKVILLLDKSGSLDPWVGNDFTSYLSNNNNRHTDRREKAERNCEIVENLSNFSRNKGEYSVYLLFMVCSSNGLGHEPFKFGMLSSNLARITRNSLRL